jgi:hypothetical protein
MTENSDKIMKVAANCGLILGFILVVFELITQIFKISLFFLTLFTFIGGIYYCTVGYREKYLEGIISYGKSVRFGVLLSGCTYFILGVYQYIYAALNPVETQELFNNVIEMMKENGFPVTEITENPMLNPIISIISYTFLGLFLGLIVSAITSAITKKS